MKFPPAVFGASEIRRAHGDKSGAKTRTFSLQYQSRSRILQSATAQLRSSQKRQSLPFTLSWTHYVFLLSIKGPDERGFYEIEAARQARIVYKLESQFDSDVHL